MEGINYFAVAGTPGAKDGKIDVVSIGRDAFPGCMHISASWYTSPSANGRSGGLTRGDSDELFVFIGSDPNLPDELNATAELRIENDVLTLTRTCAVFIPGGTARGEAEFKALEKPVFSYVCQLNSDISLRRPASASAPAGTYARNVIEGYRPPSGKMPDAPEGFLQLLLYLDGVRLKGAPYMETVWFKTANDTGPAPHEHDFDEFIGFMGTDCEHPEELGATLRFYIGDEPVTVTRSCLVYIPRGVRHSPIIVPEMARPIIHFSGGNGGDYARRGAQSDTNMFRET
ncbi:MAG: hypothetical protein LBC21_01980 [Oscillospiraceae bacterium]|jgi:hypothetical protein|nr:hypothetical protein [Oscillospiraceae bacterium]